MLTFLIPTKAGGPGDVSLVSCVSSSFGSGRIFETVTLLAFLCAFSKSEVMDLQTSVVVECLSLQSFPPPTMMI